MRLTLLLASFLVVLPGRLIFLALNPRVHVDQFVHTLYPRPPFERVRLGRAPAQPARRATTTGPTFLPSYQLNNGPTYAYRGCRN